MLVNFLGIIKKNVGAWQIIKEKCYMYDGARWIIKVTGQDAS